MYPFGKRNTPFEWIRKIPPEDREWARRYLYTNRIMMPGNAFEPDCPSIGQLDDSHHRETDQALRNAWRQRKARRKLSGKKAHNFVLSTSSKRKLDAIASDMRSTIVEALELLINDEATRVAEHKENLKLTRQTIVQLGARHKAELSESYGAQNNILHAVEIALQVQTMKLTISELRLNRPMLQHVALSELKEEALQHFQLAWGKLRSTMGSSVLGLTVRIPNEENLWSQIFAEDDPDGMLSNLPDGEE